MCRNGASPSPVPCSLSPVSSPLSPRALVLCLERDGPRHDLVPPMAYGNYCLKASSHHHDAMLSVYHTILRYTTLYHTILHYTTLMLFYSMGIKGAVPCNVIPRPCTAWMVRSIMVRVAHFQEGAIAQQLIVT